MRPKVLILIAVALLLAAIVVRANTTFQWALVGMLAAVLVVLSYDAWNN
jgi:hypothetical protein